MFNRKSIQAPSKDATTKPELADLAKLYSALNLATMKTIPVNEQTITYEISKMLKTISSELSKTGDKDNALSVLRASKMMAFASSKEKKTPSIGDDTLKIFTSAMLQSLIPEIMKTSSQQEAAQLTINNVNSIVASAYLLGYATREALDSGLIEEIDEAE